MGDTPPAAEWPGSSPQVANSIKAESSVNKVGVVNVHNYTNSTSCTGTVINANTIVTAAHCFEGTPGRWQLYMARVRAMDDSGEVHCIQWPTGSGEGCRSALVNAIIHPDYDLKVDNDIAVVQTTSGDWGAPLDVAANWSRIQTSPIAERNTFTIYGWGSTSNADAEFDALYAGVISVPIGAVSDMRFTSAQPARTWPALCKGDSGGPAMRGSFLDIPMILGLAISADRFPAGQRCPQAGTTMHYVRTSAHIGWLETVLKTSCKRYSKTDSQGKYTYARCF